MMSKTKKTKATKKTIQKELKDCNWLEIIEKIGYKKSRIKFPAKYDEYQNKLNKE